MLKKITLSILLLTGVHSVNSQVGVSFNYTQQKVTDWEQWLDPSEQFEFLKQGIGINVDYWFRIKETRIEFLPELSYRFFEEEQLFQPTDRYRTDYLSFQFNTNFYLLDMAGDCDCPTFSKDGDILSKGFFVQIGPGISFIIEEQDLPSGAVDQKDIAFFIGGGVGLDIGISDLVTITPMARLAYYPSAGWKGLQNSEDIDPQVEETVDTDIFKMRLGLRLGIRWDD